MWKKYRARGMMFLKLFLDLVLLIIFSIQAYVAGCLIIFHSIPIPTQWANQTLRTLSFEDYYVQANSFRLKLHGALELTGLKVYHDSMKLPILEASSTELEYRLLNDGALQFTPTELVLSNGTLQLPAIYAPGGARSAILENITFHLTPANQSIQIDSFAAKHKDIKLRGSINWPFQSSSETPQLEDIYNLIAQALTEKERFSPFIHPTLEFAITARPNKSVDIYTRLSCEQLKYIHATGEDFDFQTNFRLEEGRLTPLSPLLLRADQIQVAKASVSATDISAYVSSNQWSDLLDGTWPDFEISALTMNVHDVELNSPMATLSAANYPNISFSGSASGLEGGAAFSGILNSKTQSGSLHAHGSVELLSLFPNSVLNKLPKFEFGSTPYLDLKIQLEEGFALGSTTFRFDVNDVTANGLTFDHILSTGNYSNETFTLDTVLANRGKQWIDATFSLDGRHNDYKISLLGSLLPKQYDALLPKWWSNVFKDIQFSSETFGYGDFVIRGNRDKPRELFFLGRAAAENAIYKGAHIDAGEMIVRGRKHYVELHNFDAKVGKGWANGDVAFTRGNNGLISVRYGFDAKMPPQTAAKIFGETLANIISDFEIEQLPRITMAGANFTETDVRYAQSDYFNLEASIDSPLTFKKTPLEHLKFFLYAREQDIYLRDVEFGYAQGLGTANIDIIDTLEGSQQLTLNLNLQGANQAEAVLNLPSFDDVENQLTYPEIKTDKGTSDQGKLNLNVEARGPIDNLYGYNGYGSFVVMNDNIGSIQLLGPLSSLLHKTRLNFTSFNLNQMSSTFEVQQETLFFPDLIIEGARTKIWTAGTMHIPDQSLDMKVRVGLFANMGNPESTLNSFRKLLTSPLPNLLIFDLNGTIQNQKLRLRYDPRKYIPVIRNL